MTKAQRKEVTVRLGTESFYDILDQKTPEVIQRMRELVSEYPDRKISFNVAPYGYDGGLELEVWEHRLENDKEFAKRREAEAKDREKEKLRKRTNLEKEFAEYQRLQKKFQGKSEFQ
jgi:predicted choloylglycine hydrolase